MTAPGRSGRGGRCGEPGMANESAREFQESRRAAQQHAAAFARDHQAALVEAGKTKCDKLLCEKAIGRAPLRHTAAQRLQGFPLILRQIIVELGVHVSSLAKRSFELFLPRPCERDTTILIPDFDMALSANVHIALAKSAG